MINIENGKVTVSAHYGVTQNLGDYSSQKASFGLTVEYDAAGDEAVVLDEANKLYDKLIGSVKMGTLANLGIDGEPDDDGVLQPKLSGTAAAAAPTTTQAVAPAPRPQGGGGGYNGGGGGGQQFKPKADISDCPIFNADLDGQGAKNWIDLRPAKQDGRFKPGAADFRNSANARDQVWMSNKDGSVKQSVVAGLQAAGVAV